MGLSASFVFDTRGVRSLELAIQYFNEALMLDQHEPVALSRMAEIHGIQGRTDKAEQYLVCLEQVAGAENDHHQLGRKLGRQKFQRYSKMALLLSQINPTTL